MTTLGTFRTSEHHPSLPVIQRDPYIVATSYLSECIVFSASYSRTLQMHDFVPIFSKNLFPQLKKDPCPFLLKSTSRVVVMIWCHMQDNRTRCLTHNESLVNIFHYLRTENNCTITFIYGLWLSLTVSALPLRAQDANFFIFMFFIEFRTIHHPMDIQ